MRVRQASPREDGFSLIEVLVVVLIVALLAAIALPTFLKQQKQAHDRADPSDRMSLESLRER